MPKFLLRSGVRVERDPPPRLGTQTRTTIRNRSPTHKRPETFGRCTRTLCGMIDSAESPPMTNVHGEPLVQCHDSVIDWSQLLSWPKMCGGDHDVCAVFREAFWRESGQDDLGLQGTACVSSKRLAAWLRGKSEHDGISSLHCDATSGGALEGDPAIARFVSERCRLSLAWPLLTLFGCFFEKRPSRQQLSEDLSYFL